MRGSSLYGPRELFDAYREHLGKPIDRSLAAAVVGALAALYTDDGYSRPRIGIDDALIAAGILRIDVVETRIAAIRINGDPGPHRARLERLGAELEDDEVLRQRDLQDVLRRMRGLPGLTLSAGAEKSAAAPNLYELDLDAEFQRVGGSVRMTNRGTDEIGPNFMLGQVVTNGLLGGRATGGLLFGAATDYDEYRGLGVLSSMTLGDRGAFVAFTGFRSRANPREAGSDRDDRYLRDRITVRGSIPVLRGSEQSASFVAGLELADLAIARAGLRWRDERLRMLKLSLNQSWRAGSSVEYASVVELIKGLGGLGSGLKALDLTTDPRSDDFLMLRLSLIRLARFAPNWSLRLDSFAQQTSAVVPYTERFKIGGDRLGRGFEVAEVAGDQGLGAKLEVKRDLPQAPSLLGRTSVYGFYDIGATWKQGFPGGRESAATAGFGFAIRDERKTASLELARPLTHVDVEGRDDLRLFVELTLRL